MSLHDKATAGNRLDTLCALRDLLAADLDMCESMRDKAALSQRLMDILQQIEECEKSAAPKKGTVLDELNQRRAAKSSAGAGRAARSK